MGQRADRLDQRGNGDDPLVAGDAEIQQTREEMSDTLEAIQAKLSPEQMTDDAKDAAIETVDHVIEEARVAVQEWTEVASASAKEAVDHALVKLRETLPELSDQARESAREAAELASVAAMEAVDHALLKVQEAFPDLSQQAQDATREAVDHAIEEAKAAVRELGEQTRAAVRDATVGRVERMAHTTSETSKSAGSTVMQTIKQNPGPAALTALGVGWLVMNGRSGSAQGSLGPPTSSSTSQGTTGMGESVKSGVGQAQDAAGDMAHTVQDGIGTAADQVAQTATDVAGGVAQGAGTVVDGVVQGAEAVGSGAVHGATSVASGVQSTVTGASNQAKQMPGRLRHLVEENPVRLGLVAAALGGAAALAVPETRRENQMLGEARDTMVERAQSTAQSTFQKVQQVAGEVGETVEKEARYAGLSEEGK